MTSSRSLDKAKAWAVSGWHVWAHLASLALLVGLWSQTPALDRHGVESCIRHAAWAGTFSPLRKLSSEHRDLEECIWIVSTLVMLDNDERLLWCESPGG